MDFRLIVDLAVPDRLSHLRQHLTMVSRRNATHQNVQYAFTDARWGSHGRVGGNFHDRHGERPLHNKELRSKQSLRVVGAYAYHFWMAAMEPLQRVSGNQYFHRESGEYRHAVRRKISAYHRHIQRGLIAQGLLQILSTTMSMSVWRSFGSWIRTIRPGLAPSEQVTAIAMRHALPEFIAGAAKTSIFVKCLRDRLDLSRAEGINLAA